MKKFILIISILVIFLFLFFEVSRVVIVIKFGQSHEITIGRSGSIDSPPDKSIPAMKQESVIKKESFALLNGKATERQIGTRTVPAVNQPKGNGFFIPWLFNPRLATGYPSMSMSKPYKSDNFYTKPVDPRFDFRQNSESNYAYQKQSIFDIQILSNPTVNQPKGNGFFIPWLFGPRLATGYPSMSMSKPYKSDNFYTKPVDTGFAFRQDSESNYAYQKQSIFDIQILSNPTVKSNFARTEWMATSLSSNQTTNLNSEKEQSGIGNMALQNQYGLMNVALIHQVGYNNVAIQTQNGLVNVSSAFQAGSMNLCIQDQSSRYNNAEVAQSGMLNNAKQTQNQESPGSLNKALTYQGGAYNNSLQRQNGTLNQAASIQSGVGNVSEQDQAGNFNDALIAQASFGSIAHQSQNSGHSGSNAGNKAEIYQSGGSGNYAEQTQDVITGDFINSAVIRQNGSSNFARQVQAGDNTHSIISQTGRNNNSIVSQIAF